MSRKIVRLTLDHLQELSAPCRSCLFWEHDPVRRGRVSEPTVEKDAWVSHVLREWGSCGRVALVDDRPVGYLVYAPEAFVPGAAGFPTAPVSPDAVLLTTAYVAPEHARHGLGRMLVQGMARDLVRRDIRAVEAFGTLTRPKASELANSPSNCRGGSAPGCVLPVDFLGGVGFKTQRAHATTPRMRMDLRTTVSWKSEVEAALERLVGAVRPAPKATRAPEPTRRLGDQVN